MLLVFAKDVCHLPCSSWKCCLLNIFLENKITKKTPFFFPSYSVFSALGAILGTESTEIWEMGQKWVKIFFNIFIAVKLLYNIVLGSVV